MEEMAQRIEDRLEAVAELAAGVASFDQLEQALERADAAIVELSTMLGADEAAARLRAKWEALLVG